MKININKTLDNGVCRARIATSDFSELDWSLMRDFCEPTINLGGLFSTGVHGSAAGTVDMTAGYDFSDAEPAFIATYTYGALAPVVRTVVLNQACTDAAAVASHVQTQISAQFGPGIFTVTAGIGGDITISTAGGGASYSMELAAGDPDALVLLGITAAAYAGSGDDDFTLPNRLARVKSDSPFIIGFDSRDTSLARASYMGDTWAAQIVSKIEADMDALRTYADDYTDESMISY